MAEVMRVAPTELRFVAVGQDDPLAEPLLAELAVEYASRYGAHRGSGVEVAARRIRPTSSPRRAAAMLIGLLDGQPVTGGAFRRFDDSTRRAQAHLDRQPLPSARSMRRRC